MGGKEAKGSAGASQPATTILLAEEARHGHFRASGDAGGFLLNRELDGFFDLIAYAQVNAIVACRPAFVRLG